MVSWSRYLYTDEDPFTSKGGPYIESRPSVTWELIIDHALA